MSVDHHSAGPGGVSFDFTGRVAVVTGATGGIGTAITEAFTAAGADLVLHGRNTEVLEERAAQVRARGRRAVVATGNIRDPETSAGIVAAAEAEFGRVDVLINNAGGNFGVRLADMSVGAWNATVEANLSGAFHLTRAALPLLRAAGGGSVVNIGSVSANYAHPLRGAYAAAKAGLASLTRTLSWELAEDGIRVNCVEPGAVLTKASRFTDADTERAVSRHIALGRVGAGDDIASVCLFLASNGAAYITGETIRVAGGPHPSTPADVDLIRAVLS